MGSFMYWDSTSKAGSRIQDKNEMPHGQMLDNWCTELLNVSEIAKVKYAHRKEDIKVTPALVRAVPEAGDAFSCVMKLVNSFIISSTHFTFCVVKGFI